MRCPLELHKAGGQVDIVFCLSITRPLHFLFYVATIQSLNSYSPVFLKRTFPDAERADALNPLPTKNLQVIQMTPILLHKKYLSHHRK